MTALNQDRNTQMKDGKLLALLVAANVKIFAGSQVAVNADGFAVPAAADATLRVVGVADETVDNTVGADGLRVISVKRDKLFKFESATGVDLVGQAAVGGICYVVDDQTVAATDGDGLRPVSGMVFGVDTDGVWVLIA